MTSYSIKDFLERVPPSKIIEIPHLAMLENTSRGMPTPVVDFPVITLPCETESCGGNRLFQSNQKIYLDPNERKDFYVEYICRNCKKYIKRYSLHVKLNSDKTSGEIYKYGELPAFGPPTPSKVISLIGPEREYFLKGRRSESMGLGIAAFAYYRRVIENQKNRIIDEVIRVGAKVGAAPEVLADLERAKTEIQFSKSISEIKHGIPQVLLIDGHNPLTLLHSALSEGLHAQTDDQCLELATSIRVVMIELAERISIALKEEAELASAVSRLMTKKVAAKDETGN